MMFMIFMVNKYVPTIHEKDEVFGKGQHLEKLSDVKYYDILHHSKYSCGSLFDFCMLLSRGNAYTQEFFILGTKLSWYLFLYGSSSNPTRNLFICHCAYCLVYLFFPGPYILVKTNRIYLLSVLTLWLLLGVFARAENDDDTHSYHLSFS